MVWTLPRPTASATIARATSEAHSIKFFEAANNPGVGQKVINVWPTLLKKRHKNYDETRGVPYSLVALIDWFDSSKGTRSTGHLDQYLRAGDSELETAVNAIKNYPNLTGLMLADEPYSGDGEGVPTVFSTLRAISDIAYTSEDGRMVFFVIQTTTPQWQSYYSFRDEKGNWSEPKLLTIDGTVFPWPVDAMNSSGSVIAIGKQVLQWNTDHYAVVREFDFDYKDYYFHQITDDGKTLYMIASLTPQPDSRVSDPLPRQFDLLQIHWTDDPKNPEIKVIASAHDIDFRLLGGGKRLIYRARNYPTLDVNTWGGY